MTAGLPGAGIGGIFYLASALAMPACELYRAVRYPHEPRRWGLAARQALLAGGILGGLWATGWLLGLLFSATGVESPVARPDSPAVAVQNVVRIGTLAFSLITLALVLVAVQVLRLALRPPAPAAPPAPLPLPGPAAAPDLARPGALRHRQLRKPISATLSGKWRRRGENSGRFPRYSK